MNILERPDAVFALPAELVRERMPKLDPRIIAREHIQDGERVVVAMLYGGEGFYRLSPNDWAVLQLFDGERDYAAISELTDERVGLHYTENEVREFAESYEGTEFFYKTALEKNVAVANEFRDRRRHRAHHLDFTDITVLTWPSKEYLEWLEPKLRFIYTGWFTAFTLLWFGFMAYIFADRAGELWNDSIHYYNFTAKGLSDLAEFWVLFAVVVFFHETAHGLTSTHWGASVHRMGFNLLYFAPSFFCDVSEAWVRTTKWQRISIMFAGCWVELMMCAAAAVVWWGTSPGMVIHDLAYKFMLVAGIAVIVLNLNPLIKLDGYYIFCDLIGIPDLKERSTRYLSNWIRSKVGLPAEVTYVGRKRKILFLTYGILSGIYSYVLLAVVCQWTYNATYSLWPEWAFIPALALALYIFRTPLGRFRSFVTAIYLDKKERWAGWLRGPRRGLFAASAVVLLVVALLPIWRDTVSGRFVLESPQRAVVRAEVPGIVSDINVDEGQRVAAGTPVAHLRNVALQSTAAEAQAAYDVANARATQSQLQYANLAAANAERERSTRQKQVAQQQESRLALSAPISGSVTTPRVRDLVGTFVEAGTTIAEIEDLDAARARIYVPEAFMQRIRLGAPVSLLTDGTFHSLQGNVEAISPASAEPVKGIHMLPEGYEGYDVPQFYTVFVTLRGDRNLRPGMMGTGKILDQRRSLAGFAWKAIRDFAGRRLW